MMCITCDIDILQLSLRILCLYKGMMPAEDGMYLLTMK